MPNEPTPVRALGTRHADGYVLLRDIGLDYRDGGEEEVLRVISGAADLTSTSDELIRSATDWAQTYHLHPARANVVRCLDLPRAARVLEIGSGCGAITRYLGERCGTVDAIEPMPARAAAARARTRDQAHVEVFVGELSDVPAQAAYDVVVVIGVLEYVARGGRDRAPYLEFLRGVRERLAPGGSLVLAIENQLGVKYLAGAPEDHSNRPFDSLEDYPVGTPARTFSRRQLSELMTEAGFQPSFHSAFPDYKLTRAVFGQFPGSAESLLYRIPQFPSPDWAGTRPQLADERLLWQTLVEAGLADQTGNSFLVLAGKDGPSPLWPDDVAATFYSVGRREQLSAQTVVRRFGDTVEFDRTPVVAAPAESPGRFTVAGSQQPFEPGQDLLDVVARDRDIDLNALFDEWLALVDERHAYGDTGTLDVVPHNLVLGDDGKLRIIDIELIGRVEREQIIRRGVFWAAHHVARVSPDGRWGPARTVRDIAIVLGVAAGLPDDGSWLDQAVAEEVEVQLAVQNGPVGMTEEQWRDKFGADLRALLDQQLVDMPLGKRLPDRMRELKELREAERVASVQTVERMTAEAHDLRDQLADVQARHDALANSRVMRLANRYRQWLGRALPVGTGRRRTYDRLIGRRG